MELGMGGEGSLYICAQHHLFSLLHNLERVVYRPELQSKGFHCGHPRKGSPNPYYRNITTNVGYTVPCDGAGGAELS